MSGLKGKKWGKPIWQNQQLYKPVVPQNWYFWNVTGGGRDRRFPLGQQVTLSVKYRGTTQTIPLQPGESWQFTPAEDSPLDFKAKPLAVDMKSAKLPKGPIKHPQLNEECHVWVLPASNNALALMFKSTNRGPMS
jgi:hypothetical protein